MHFRLQSFSLDLIGLIQALPEVLCFCLFYRCRVFEIHLACPGPYFLASLLFTPFSPIVLQSTNFKSSWIFHLAWFFLVEFYCVLIVYFLFISQWALFASLVFRCSWGVMAFQAPGKNFYKLGDHMSSFVLHSTNCACCFGVQSKYFWKCPSWVINCGHPIYYRSVFVPL